ncbi:MAG: 50S ribosomal protein L22 [Nanopusillaceae archaeon]
MNSKLLYMLKEQKKLVSVKAYNLPISRKKTVNLVRYIRYLPLKIAKKYLELVIQKKIAIPFYKYNRDIPHRKNIDAKIKQGRYPIKSAKYLLKLLDSLEKNAINMNLDPSKIFLLHVLVNKGNTMPRKINYIGRGVRRKSTHIEIYGVFVDQYDTSRKYKRKELKNLIKSLIKEWLQKI